MLSKQHAESYLARLLHVSSHVSKASGIVVPEVVHRCNVVLLMAHRLRCHLSRVMAASQMVYTPSSNKMVYSVLVEGVAGVLPF